MPPRGRFQLMGKLVIRSSLHVFSDEHWIESTVPIARNREIDLLRVR